MEVLPELWASDLGVTAWAGKVIDAKAVSDSVAAGVKTPDIGGSATTQQVSHEVMARLLEV